ncbi:hypothetical protein [Glutamicibacter protophormiae]
MGFSEAEKTLLRSHARPLDDMNAIFDEMPKGKIDGRIVIHYA